MAKKNPPKQTKAERPTKIEFESFREMGDYDIRSFDKKSPSCWNGSVSIHRYRYTVELIPESKEVLGARLQHLWDHSENHHDREPLQAAAAEIGYELVGSRGNKRER